MKQTAAYALVLALAAAPTLAQEQGEEGGRSLMERGMELFFDGLRQEAAPMMEDLKQFADSVGPSMRSFLEEMGPALAEIVQDVKDWTTYYPPEMLPNGDIIIRKRPERPAEPETLPEDDGKEPVMPAPPTDI